MTLRFVVLYVIGMTKPLDLDAIARDTAAAAGTLRFADRAYYALIEDVPALIAEVRRLRALEPTETG